MKRMLWLAVLLLCAALTGCALSAPFDPETEGVVDVIVESGGVRGYYAVNASGRKQETEVFEGDAITIYEVDGGCFETYMGIENDGDGEFINRLADIRLWDENGCAVQNTSVLNEILLAASELEHDLFDVRILRAGEEYFLHVELNVNWVSPCDLYWYDQARRGLVEVCSFDGRKTVGLRVRDLSRLASRPVYEPDQVGWTKNPLRTWRGQYRLELTADGVDLIGPEGVIARRVTGYWYVGWSDGSATGFVSADGYHVIDENAGSITAYAALSEMPERYAREYADEGFNTLNHFRFAYGEGDPQAALAALRAQFEEIRAQHAAAEEDALLEALQAALLPRYTGSENGAAFLHFAVVDDSGRTTPARLYYAPDAAAAEACASGWMTWENLGGGWYMGALDNALH